jgi:hypothetical protein
MRKPRLSIDARLTAARIAIDNALLDTTLHPALARYGFDLKKLQHGKQLYQLAADLRRHQRTGYGSQAGATDTLAELNRHIRTKYMRLVKVARIALKDHRIYLMTLDLHMARKQSLAGWIAQAEHFYGNALDTPAIMWRLAEFGITDSTLRTGQQELEKVKSAQLAQAKGRGMAQKATQDRNHALAELDEWYRDFAKIARIAFADEPQQLEKLGIAARSGSAPTPALAAA